MPLVRPARRHRACRFTRPRRRSYAQTLNRRAPDVGANRAITMLDADALDGAMQDAWVPCAPATWNRHVATARSFVAFCRRGGWLAGDVAVGVDRRCEPVDRTRAFPYARLERLWRRSDVGGREKALWRLLYENAVRASEVLSLDIGDVDLEDRRAVVCSKGGDLELLHVQTGSARLLPRLIAGRASGPVFVTHRRPAPAGAGHRRCLRGHGSCAAVLPSRGGDLPSRFGRLDAASAAPLRDHASCRRQRGARAADGQEPPQSAERAHVDTLALGTRREGVSRRSPAAALRRAGT
jgi:integrase